MKDTPTLLFIYNEIAGYYGMEFFQLCHSPIISDKRKMFCLIARNYGYSYYSIRDFLDMKSHSSVIIARKRMLELISIYPSFKSDYESIRQRIDKAWNTPLP